MCNFASMGDQEQFHNLVLKLVDHISEAIIVFDKKGEIIYVNKAIERIIKLPKDRLIGKQITGPQFKIKALDGNLLNPEEQPFSKAIKENISMSDIEVKLEKPDKVDVIILLNIVPLKNKDVEPCFVASFKNISKLKKEDEKLKDSEKRYKSLVNNSPDGIFVYSKGKILFVNPAAIKIFGAKNKEELLGKCVISLVHRDYRDRVAKRIEKMFATGKKAPLKEEKYLKLDGTAIDIECTASPIIFKNTKAIQVVFRDITESKKKERALIEYEHRFHKMLKKIKMVALILDTEGNITFANDYLLETTGWESKEVIGKNWFDLFIPKEKKIILQQVFYSLMKGESQPINYENEIMNKKGERIVISFTNLVIKDSDQNVTSVASIGKDVTEERKINRKLKESEEESRKNEQQLRTVIEAINDAVVLCEEGKIAYWNNSATNIFGYGAKEVIWKPVTMLIPDKDLTTKHNAGLERYITTGETKIIDKQPYETYIKRKDGKIIPIEISLFRNYSGKGISFICVIKEITKQKKIIEELKELEQRYKVVLETATDAIIQCKNGIVTYWNKSAERILNYKASEIMGKPVISLMPDRFIEDHRKGVEKVTTTGESNIVGKKTYEIYGKRKDGSEVPLELSVAKNTVDNEVFFTGILRDITERKKAEEQLQGEYKKAERIAVTLQKSLLPSEIPKIKDLEIKFYYQATGEGEVGGDFYDVFKTSVNTYGILVGDVSGKGVEVAAETARVKYLLRDRAFDGSAPSEVMQKVNNSLVTQNTTQFTALTYGLYNPLDSTIELVNAGNPFPYFVNKDTFLELKGMPVSLFPNQKYASASLKMKKGDSLIIYSDGVIETHRGKELFGEKRVSNFIRKNKHLPLDQILKGLVEEARKFSKGRLRDDILVVGIKKL